MSFGGIVLWFVVGVSTEQGDVYVSPEKEFLEQQLLNKVCSALVSGLGAEDSLGTRVTWPTHTDKQTGHSSSGALDGTPVMRSQIWGVFV